jgi:hypothetical protein
MMTLKRILSISALALAIAGVSQVNAQDQQGGQGRRRGGGGQGGGNFDPAQMRERMLEQMKERFEVTKDDEWKIISERITKVQDAQRDARPNNFGMFRRPGGDQANNGGDNNRRRFGGEPMPEQEALQKAIEAKASADEIKTKLAKLRDARKVKEANLVKAQEDLRKVLSSKQEAVAVLFGLLN